jgi:hypothetical protein
MTTKSGPQSIAHFGTTLAERAPQEGEDIETMPKRGDLERTDRFLTILGMEVYITNMYPGVGRQYIYRRGEMTDVDYFEKDTFTSFTATLPPAAESPRVGETIFRITDKNAISTYRKFLDEDLITSSVSEAAFLSGSSTSVLFLGPDQQHYELCHAKDSMAENHRIYIWTDPKKFGEYADSFCEHFSLNHIGTEDFHGVATAYLLRRENPGVTIALLVPVDGKVAPKWSKNIFNEAGYSHFRLGSTNKNAVLDVSEEAFPEAGGVAFVHFHDSYLELVQH